MKIQASDWEKIANEATNKGLTQNIQAARALQQKNKQSDKKKKWAEELNRHFSKEDIQIANKHMKRCIKLLISREMQIKITMR